MIEGAECECGVKVIPERKTCPECKKPMKKAEFGDFGTVLTHTTLHTPPEGYEGPIRLCMVKIDGGAQLLCGYDGEKDLDIGEHVKIIKKNKLYFCKPMV